MVFRSQDGLVGWTPTNGQGALWYSGDVSGDTLFEFGTDRVLLFGEPGTQRTLKLVGAAGIQDVEEALSSSGYEIWRAARASYSRIERAFYWTPGAQSVWGPAQLQKLLRIDESTGAATVLASSDTAQANFGTGVSPSGRYLITTFGGEARAEIRDLTSGAVVAVDLDGVAPTNVPLRHPERPIGRGVFEFHWSPDESHVAARFEAYQDNDPVSAEKFAGSNIYVMAARGFVVEVSSGRVRDLGDFQPRGWVEGELQLLGEQDGIALERGGERWSLLPLEANLEIIEHSPFRSSGLSAVFENSRPNGQSCANHPGIRALQSKANGFVKLDVEYVEALRTLVIRGSADDQDLAGYLIEYQMQGSSEWTGILSGTGTVDDQVFGAWSPPAPGRYRLRLRVEDRAGNGTETTQEIVWFDSEALGLVRADLRHISPNGDAVQDQLALSYELRAAAELDVRIESSEGTVLHNEHLVHSQPGTFEWRWSGRHQNGAPMPDGEYRVNFASRAFVVSIDNTPPTIEITENPPGSTQCLPGAQMTPSEHGGTVGVRAVDQSFDHIRVESRPRNGSTPWVEQSRYRAEATVPLLGINLRPRDLREEEFRVVAVDRAGNRRVEPFEVLGLGVASARIFGGLPVGRPWHDIGPGETPSRLVYQNGFPPSLLLLGLMARSLDGWQVEYRGGGSWQVLPHFMMPAEEVPNPGETCFLGNESWIGVNLPTLPATAEIRLRRQSGTGEQHSNRLRVEEKPALFCPSPGPGDPPPEPGDPDECPSGPNLPSGGGDDPPSWTRCYSVGVDEVALPSVVVPLPIEPQLASVRWFDSRNGNTLQLPLVPRPVGQLAAIDVSALPIGEHVVRVEYSDGTVRSTTIGRSPAEPPAPTVDRPLPNERLCVGDPQAVTGLIDHPFLDGVFSTIGNYSSGTGPDRFGSLGRPDGLPGLSNAAPTNWQIQVRPDVALSEGPGILRVRSQFCGRHSPWVERPVVIDRSVLIEAPRLGPNLDNLQAPTTMVYGIARSSYRFSPTLGQKAWIVTRSHENVQARASLYAVATRPVFHPPWGTAEVWAPVGPVLRDLGSLGPLTGPLRWEWDGRDAQGQVLEGEYVVVIVSQDDCGHVRTEVVPVAVDDTPPLVQWLDPAPGSTAALFQPLRARAADQLTVHVQFTYSALVGGGQWLQIGSESVSARDSHEYTKVWHSNLTPGTYRLRFTARDEVGLEGHTEVEVQIPQRSPLTLAAVLNNELISPNNDGVLDSTTLGLSFSRSAQVTLQIRAPSGAVVRTLANAIAMHGNQSVLWNGADDAAAMVPDGDYRMALRVVDPAQPAHVEEAEFPVAVDNTPPQLQMLAPAGAFSNGRGALTLEMEDAHPLGVQASASPPMPGLLAQHQGGGVLELVQLDEIAEGSYTLNVQGQDRAGNRSQLTHAFTLDRSAPAVSIQVPTAGAVVTRAAGPIAVQGLVSDANLLNRALELRSADATLAVLATDTGVSSGPWSTQWSGIAADGPYVLRLLATDRAGNQGQTDVPVVLDNTPPLARIDAPTQGASVGASFAIHGAATDVNFDRLELDLAPRTTTPIFQRIAEGDVAADGLLATVLAPPVDGNYLLRLRVHDRAGHVSEAFREIVVDTLPPAAPTQLRAERLGARDARLTWSAPVPVLD
ncbi:MAG: FlgD immunoglobulin-like domain containing protein, partial [Gammaproteobacteria bacterium]|nr:FlgD immunoglobulin-like domain containing protein [Gammaproteobacteria bacterium]